MSTGRRVGGVLAAALVAAFLVWGIAGGWSKAASYPWELDAPLLVAAIAVLTSFYLVWAVGYVALVELLARRRLERGRLRSIWARSLLGRYVPGNVLMVAGRVVLGREAGVPARVSLAASVYEQVAMLAAAGVASAAFLLWGGQHWSPAFWLVLAIPLALVVLDPALLRRVTARLPGRLGALAELELLTRGQLAGLLAWFAATMALLAAGAGLGVRAVAGSQPGGLGYVGLGFLFSWAVSMLVFVFPSGLGIREGVFAVVLGRHLPTAAAVSLAAASRLLITAVEVAVVGALAAAAWAAARHDDGTGSIPEHTTDVEARCRG